MIRNEKDYQKVLNEATRKAYDRGYDQAEQNEYEKVQKCIEKINERTGFLDGCVKYGNESAEQQAKSYATMMLYEVADLVDDVKEIIKEEMGV